MAAPTGICAHPHCVFPDAERLAAAAAARWIALCHAALAARGVFHVALSGGSTPKRLYHWLARPDQQAVIDWTRVQLWFGDERAVPPEHTDSNYRMVRETLLDHIAIPPQNVHRMHAEPAHIEQNAVDYAAQLRQLPQDAAGMSVFDLILLGMGPDGHTCSLFPGTPILHERARSVAAVHVQKLDSWRLSLTYPVLDAARQLLFLVAGADKAPMLRQVCRGAADVPVQGIRPRGEVEWYLDAAAAAELNA